MNLKLTMKFQKVPLGYIGYVDELPGANSQGVTLDEVKSNLMEAIEMVLDANRYLSSLESRDNIAYQEELEIVAI
ncbi:MAG: type II toxin-antitoxin system HicB family antitoxin [Candidatus Kapabacteria bacterium]|nr:type II toxin-antitoxin system HicB family antitoxin [Candidatus Kapabacteria bacterium]